MSGNVKRSILWSVGFLLLVAGVAPTAQSTQTTPPGGQATGRLRPRRRRRQQPAAPPSPVQLANQAERQRIMNLLKISAIPPGAVSSSPATYNEADANPYPNLPDPLTLKNGQKVTTRGRLAQQASRRAPRGLPARDLRSHAEDAQGHVVRRQHDDRHERRYPIVTKQLLGKVDNSSYPEISVEIQATLEHAGKRDGSRAGHHHLRRRRVPAGARRRGAAEPVRAAGRIRARGAGPGAAGAAAVPRGSGSRTRPGAGAGPTGPTWQQQVLAKGWGYANLNTGSVQADCGAGLTSGIIGLVNKGQPRALDDWGALSAWGWGASRLLDYFETDKDS